MMIHKKLLIGALAVASAIVPVATTQAQHLSIELGDRGYYNHGPFYYSEGYRMVWIRGHWGSRHRWVHGHYARRERERNWRRHHERVYIR
ncbi:MAG: hypothetical protein ACR2HH_00140 [Chthoniobacterales bacterium]